MFPIHTTVFPFNGERSVIFHVVQGADNLFKIDVPTTNRTEIPVSSGITKVQMSTKHARQPGCVCPPDILHVDVINPMAQPFKESDVVNTLIAEMARIVVKSEGFSAVDRLNRAFRSDDVKSDFSRMDFESELDTDFIKDIENRVPTVGEIFKTGINLCGIIWWKRVKEMPYSAASKAVDNAHTEFRGGARCVFHFFGGTFLDTSGVSIPPNCF